MTTKYFALLTQLGADKLANAAALGTKLDITHMAVGDGGGTLPTPDTNQTKLVNECRRAAINVLSVDPKNTHQIIAEQVIPESEGGWWIREIGLFDKDGILIAVGNCAETYKPQLQEGSGRTQTLRMVLIVSHTEAVTLKIDPSVVLATREYADALVKQAISEHEKSRRHPDATLREKGFVMLSNAVDSYSETQAATPRAVKTAHDLAAKANQSANNALEKSKNGADIPNKNEFVKNLGLIAQGTGNSTITVMSQKAVTDLANKKADAEIFDSSGATRIFNSPKTHYIRVSHGGYLEFRRVEDDFKIVQFTPDGIMTDGEIPINFVSGFNEIFVGSLGHFPFRATQLPKKWYALNGDRFSITSAQGKALKYLPEAMKTDWGIVESGGMINVPNIKQSDGRVPFLRPINDTSRLPGSVELDCIQEMTGFLGGRDVRASSGWTSFFWGESGVFGGVKKASGPGHYPVTQSGEAGNWSGVEFKASNQVRTGDENRPLNIGITVAIFLGV